MGTFTSTKVLNGNPSLNPTIANRIVTNFQNEGYTMDSRNYNNTYDISLSKGGLFKTVLGMKSALKITIKPQGNQIYFEAGVGIFGQQAIPTVITMFVFWPVMIPQIWGIIQQSQLDDKALAIAEQVINETNANRHQSQITTKIESTHFCPHCGTKLLGKVKFCSNCGEKLD